MPRDCRERLIGPALIFEIIGAHGHHMLHALIFANELRAWQGAIIGADASQRGIAAIQPLAEGFEPLACFGPQPAIGEFLDAIGEPAFDIASAEGWRLLALEHAPLLLQIGDRRGAQCREAGQHLRWRDFQRGRVDWRLLGDGSLFHAVPFLLGFA